MSEYKSNMNRSPSSSPRSRTYSPRNTPMTMHLPEVESKSPRTRLPADYDEQVVRGLDEDEEYVKPPAEVMSSRRLDNETK